jgi:protein gp37
VNEGVAPAGNSALTLDQKKTLSSLETLIEKTKMGIINAFFLIVAAFYRIKTEQLYRGTHDTFEAYFIEKWNYKRSQSYRLADAGEIGQRQEGSPRGEIIKLLDSESHYRPLAKLTVQQQDAVIDLIGAWIGWSGQQKVTPRMVESAVAVLHPPTEAALPNVAKNALVEKFEAAVDGIKQKLPAGTSKEIRLLFDQLKKKTSALGNPTRTTGIDWTEATWNPLQGCSPASAGCANCYAAKLVATRLASVYPGLATKNVGKGGKKTYVFNNIIKLLPEQLGEPLKDQIPKRYFVNSMSDLFHPKVPDDFITAVFQVMEAAHQHEFQLLTKRTDRMAKFTSEYWKDRTPPPHIWLGTSTENQKAFDERYPHLLKVKAAVRWLSIEPLIGPITFDSLEGVDWVVVGGESGSKRKMEKVWATDIRDACAKAGVPFFFKQWGEYGEDGKKLKKVKKDGLTPPSLEGVIHNAYPGEVDKAPTIDNPVKRSRERPKKSQTLAVDETPLNPEVQQPEDTK